MTKDEKLRILAEAEHRAYEEIKATPGAEMGSEKTLNLLETASKILWLTDALLDLSLPACGFVAPREEGEEPTAKVSEPEPAAEQEKPVEPAPEGPKITKDEIRAKLAELSAAANVDVAAIMSGMGYSKLSQIPAERYAELLEKAEAAKGGT